MTLAQLAILSALADRQLPGIAQNIGPMLGDNGSLLLTGFVLRPAGDDDFEGDPESEENAQCGWVFEVHAAAIGGDAGVGNVAVKMLLSFSPKLSRDTVIEHLDRESKARFPGDAPDLGAKPTRFTVIVELDAFGADADSIRERISACLGTHPTLSLRVESVQAIEGGTYAPIEGFTAPPPLGGIAGAYRMPQTGRIQAAEPNPARPTSTAILDDMEMGRQSASAGEARIPPSGVFWDAWLNGYDEVAGKPSIPLALPPPPPIIPGRAP